ncbi:MAG: chemotaxis protein CheB [Acidobacteriota bacterium]
MATSKGKRKPLPKKKAASAADRSAHHDYAASVFPVIGIGASAGGLEPIIDVIGNVSLDCGMAFIIVQHHDPKVATALPQILGRSTKMPVKMVAEGETLQANVVYVAPSDAEVTVEQGIVHVGRHAERVRMPIDSVFRSLAEDLGSRAIGVILSGAASDGTLGAKAIKAEGGIVFAQDGSARFDSMPRSAIAAGAADFVLDPKEIAHELQRIARHSYVSGLAAAGGRLKEAELAQVFSLLRAAHDTDFTHYKPATVERRIRRRMAVRKTEALGDYLEVLRKNKDEVEQLYGDILIRVTGFFRDRAVFETLQRAVFPVILREHEPESVPVRISVPGCATGEEVYSIVHGVFRDRRRLSGSDLRNGRERERHRPRPQRTLSGEHRRRCLARAAAAVLHQDRRRLPREQGRARLLHFRPPGSDQGPSLLPARSDQLPQRVDLPRRGPAAAGHEYFSLRCTSTASIPPRSARSTWSPAMSAAPSAISSSRWRSTIWRR